MKTQLLIPAAGGGVRLGCQGPKALVDVAGTPLLVRTLWRFAPLGLLDNAVIVFPSGWKDAFEAALAAAFPGTPFVCVEGGAERQVSVSHGLAALDPDTRLVVIHDAARPFVPAKAVSASCEAARASGAATVAVPCSDTILEADEARFLVGTPDRTRLWACQTPQTFQVDVIRQAYERAWCEGVVGTDDATLVRRTGGNVRLVMGSPLNFKVTTPDDLALAELLIKEGTV